MDFKELTVDGAEMSPAQMEEGYLEYRREFYRLLWGDAVGQGLLDFLTPGTTVGEIYMKWCDGGEEEALRRLLRALGRYGALDVRPDPAGGLTCTLRPGFEHVPPDLGLIERAVGSAQAEALVHAKTYGNIVQVIRNGNNKVESDFVEKNLGVWDEFLSLPFYTYFRNAAVRRLAKGASGGGVFLDAACGLGYGTLELSALLPSGSTVVGIDTSHDFVRLAIERTSHLDHIVMLRADLGVGLSMFAPGSVHGIMIVGAWHFLPDPLDVLRKCSRALSPGGHLVISYYFTDLPSFDRELMELRLSLRKPVARQTNPAALKEHAAAVGLEVVGEFSIGAFGHLELVQSRAGR